MKITFQKTNIALLALVGLAVGIVACQSASAQMGKRAAEHYLTQQFLTDCPAIGTQLPELTLRNLAGEEVELSSYVGKTLVLIKGGYT